MHLYKNAFIATMDEEMPVAQAMAVDGEKFVFVGSDEEALAFAQGNGITEENITDMQGAFICPGFTDSHLHFIHYVKAKSSVDLFGCPSLAELKQRMARGLADNPPSGGRFLMGEGWNHEFFSDEKRFPTARDLDEVSTEYPIIIMRTCFHIGVLNSRAMEILGLNKESAAAHGEFVELDENGQPNGVIKENFLDDIKASLPSQPLSDLLEDTVKAQNDLFALGITAIHSDDFKYAPEEKPYELMEGLRELSESGRLKLRFCEQALLTEQSTLDEFFEKADEKLLGGRDFRVSTVKILADGSLGGRTAYMLNPYSDAPDTQGLAIYEQEELNKLVLTSHLHNMPVAIHVIGDGAAEMAINAIGNAVKTAPDRKLRHGLVHCQVCTPSQLERMAALDIQAFTQPVFINGDMHIAYDRLGQQRTEHSYTWKKMLELGIHQSFGTDSPVEGLNPMAGIYCAVTRKDFDGNGPFLPEQALTIEEALYGYTAAGAYAGGDENIKGKIKPGMLSDFITLDRNLYTCPSDELLHARVLGTWVGGEMVFKA